MNKGSREKLLVGAALLCVVLLAGDKLVLGPAIEGWKLRAARIAELRQNLERGELLVERENTISESWGAMRRGSLPENRAFSEQLVLTALQGWAADSNLALTQFQPAWPSDNDPTADFLEVRASGRGDIEAVCRFLLALESDKLAVRLEDFTIRSRDEQGEDLSLDLRLTGLMLADKDGAS